MRYDFNDDYDGDVPEIDEEQAAAFIANELESEGVPTDPLLITRIIDIWHDYLETMGVIMQEEE